jgi:ankyrin repeat protein/Cdc6-like AAA superfamily ATPase
MEGSRKRKLSDGEAAHSSSLPQDLNGEIESSRPTHQANTDNAFGQRRSGHTFIGSTTRDQARSHLGDSYTWNNYHGPPPNAEDPEARRHKAFMEALAFRRMEYREMAVEHAYATTCQWIFKEEAFLKWRDPAFRETNRGIFWIKGKPGSGKSTLMKCVLEHIRREQGACTTASFFFNARGGTLEKTVEGCYRTLLHQLLEQVPGLLTSIRIPIIFEKGQSLPVEVLQSILREAMLLQKQDPLVLIIDALDECLEKDIRDMVRFLENLTATSHLNGVTLWVCLASRHYPGITTRFCESLIVEAAYDHTRDIREYVQGHLNVEPTAHRSLLSNQLVRRSEGVFLWAILVVRNINEAFDHGATQGQLQDFISEVPDDLNLLIGSIIASRASDKHLLPSLLWLLSGRWMTLKSLSYGIKLGAGALTSPLRDSNASDKAAMVRFIVNVSGGLVEIADKEEDDEDRANEEDGHGLQFIHESVRQHILTGGLASLDSRLSSNVAPTSHVILLEWCQTYFELPLPLGTEFPVEQHTSKVAWGKLVGKSADRDTIRRRVFQAFPFLHYVCSSMLYHMAAAFAGKLYDLDHLYDFPLQDWIDMTNVTMIEGAYYVPSTSLLHLLLEDTHYGLDPDAAIIQGILERYPTRSMMLQHTEETTKSFRRRTLDICIGSDLNNYCGGLHGTPLAAASSGQGGLTKAHVQMLLDRGADPNVCIGEIDICGDEVENWETPLQGAVAGTDITTVKLLLDHGANVNRRGGLSGSALSAAAATVNQYGFGDRACEVSQLLLDRGADINLEDSKGRNIALHHDTCHYSPNDEALSWLVAHGARAGFEQANELLKTATEQCKAESIRLSVQLGADPDNKDIDGCTGLYKIAEGSDAGWGYRPDKRLSSATAFLDLGADVNALGGAYETCLIAASSKGFEELVRLFLGREAEVHHRSRKYGTALEAAEAAGHQAICNLLRLAMK